MRCNTGKKYLQSYLDGELPAEEKELFEEHMKLCPVCGKEVELSRTLIASLQREHPPEIPPYLEERIRAKANAGTGERRIRHSVLFNNPVRGVAFALILIIVIAVPLLRFYAPPVVREAQLRQGHHRELFHIVSPMDNTVVPEDAVDICASFPRDRFPADGCRIKLFIDDRDVSHRATVTDDFVMYTPGEPMTKGYHMVTVSLEGRECEKREKISWLFYVIPKGA
jgi:hypothetical protein